MTNVLIITTDQQRADTLGVAGNPLGATPTWDALARQGTWFRNARTVNPLCQPARASLLTGLYPSRTGVTCNGRDLPDDMAARGLGQRFTDAGFRTGFFGKAHFATTFPYFPTGKAESVEGSARYPEDWYGPYCGFSHVELILFGHNLRVSPLSGWWNWCFGPSPIGLHYGRYLYRDGPARGAERIRLMSPEAAGLAWDRTQTWPNQLPEEDHPTTWVADRACDWLRRVDGPFFAWVSFTDPHHPMDPPEPWFSRYSPADAAPLVPRPVAGDIEGKPPTALNFHRGLAGTPMEWANPGWANHTEAERARMTAAYYGMVAQLDHAIARVLATLDERGLADDTLVVLATDHGEFLGEHQMVFKGPFCLDSLLRVPMVVRGPGVPAGATSDEVVTLLDIAPTALATAGLDVPGDLDAPGLLAPREHAVIEHDFDIIVSLPMRALATQEWKVITYLSVPFGELYDLRHDPGETRNLWDDPGYASVRSDLVATLEDARNHDVRTSPAIGLVA